eukprot:Em0003g1827a
MAILDKCVAIREDCIRFSEQLRRGCSEISALCKPKGRKKAFYMQKSSTITVLSGEFVTINDHTQLVEDLDNITLLCNGYEKELDDLYKQIALAAAESSTKSLVNAGKPYNELSQRQKLRKLKEVRENAKEMLWWAESFGLTPVVLQCQTCSTNSTLQLELQDNVQMQSSTCTYRTTENNRKEKLLQALYLIDRFNVGDKFYHELSMVLPNLPRSYQIKQVRTELNSSLRSKTYRVPEPHHGVYCSITELLSKEIENLAESHPGLRGEYIKVKISGDGLGQANSIYACIWCLVPASDRWNTSKLHKRRCIEDIQGCAAEKSYSVKHAPLLPIDLDHVVADELHLFLRIMDILLGNIITQVVEMDDFDNLYKCISSWTPNSEMIKAKAEQWIANFIALSTVSQGYQKASVTPYMHIMAVHVPEMIALYGNIKQFSCQGVEKLNDIAKCSYFSSSKWDPAQEILLTEQRMSATQHLCRKRRAYTKKDDEYCVALLTGRDVEDDCGVEQLAMGLKASIEGAIHATTDLYDQFASDGPGYGYFAEPTKSVLVVAPQYEDAAKDNFKDLGITVSVAIASLELPTSLAGPGIYDSTATALQTYNTSKQGTATVSGAIKGVTNFHHEQYLEALNTARKLRAKAKEIPPMQFRDCLAIRYLRDPLCLPPRCDGGGAIMSLQHALDCKKGGLIIQRHDEIRDCIGDMAAQVWSPVIKEPVVREADVSTGDDGL